MTHSGRLKIKKLYALPFVFLMWSLFAFTLFGHDQLHNIVTGKFQPSHLYPPLFTSLAVGAFLAGWIAIFNDLTWPFGPEVHAVRASLLVGFAFMVVELIFEFGFPGYGWAQELQFHGSAGLLMALFCFLMIKFVEKHGLTRY